MKTGRKHRVETILRHGIRHPRRERKTRIRYLHFTKDGFRIQLTQGWLGWCFEVSRWGIWLQGGMPSLFTPGCSQRSAARKLAEKVVARERSKPQIIRELGSWTGTVHAIDTRWSLHIRLDALEQVVPVSLTKGDTQTLQVGDRIAWEGTHYARIGSDQMGHLIGTIRVIPPPLPLRESLDMLQSLGPSEPFDVEEYLAELRSD